MRKKSRLVTAAVALGLTIGLVGVAPARADEYSNALANFKQAGQSATFFHTAYAYALFPDVGEGAFIVGGQGGKGHVYQAGHLIGTSIMGGLSVGFQAGGKVYSEVIFFQDQHALEDFESGNFEFSAGTSATAATAQLGASAGSNGAQANASTTDQNATTAGVYEHGMAVFTIAKGGLMFAANVGGQKFSYKPRHHSHVARPADSP
jgi:lipid-binding SYLF domain-containing protein